MAEDAAESAGAKAPAITISTKNMSKMIRSLPLRITLIKPPLGVPFCLQQGKDDLVPPTSDSGENVSFDFTVNIANNRTDGPPNFRGQFVQGPTGGRFIYINSGTYAGHSDSCWSRRAKVPLSGITWELIEEALSKSGYQLIRFYSELTVVRVSVVTSSVFLHNEKSRPGFFRPILRPNPIHLRFQ